VKGSDFDVTHVQLEDVGVAVQQAAQGGEACLSIRKHDNFTPTREIRRHVRALAHPVHVEFRTPLSSEYRGTSLIRNRTPLGSYSRTMPRVLWWSYGGGHFLMSEVPLYGTRKTVKDRFWHWRAR